MSYDYRRIMGIGVRVLKDDGPVLFDRASAPMGDRQVTYRIVFWVPVRQRDRARLPGFKSLVKDAREHELAALRSGELREVLSEFTFPRALSPDELKEALMPCWDELAKRCYGEAPKLPAYPEPRHHKMSIKLH